MEQTISISLGEHFQEFIASKINSGKFKSTNEVINVALELLEEEELRTKHLIAELEYGENSGFVDNFDPEEFLRNSLQSKQL